MSELTPEQRAKAEKAAKAQAGKPYAWSGVGLAGFDCSKLTRRLLEEVRRERPR